MFPHQDQGDVYESEAAELGQHACEAPQSSAASSTEEVQTVDVHQSCHHHPLSHPAALGLQVGEVTSLICVNMTMIHIS